MTKKKKKLRNRQSFQKWINALIINKSVDLFRTQPVKQAIKKSMHQSINQSFSRLPATELSPRDPRWIGAWWLGFLVLGLLSIVTASFVYCFPQKLKTYIVKKKAERLGEERKKEDAKSEKQQGWLESVKNNLKGLRKDTKSLLCCSRFCYWNSCI